MSSRDAGPTDQDRRVVLEAVSTAKQERPDLDGALFDFLASILLGGGRDEREPDLVAQHAFSRPADR